MRECEGRIFDLVIMGGGAAGARLGARIARVAIAGRIARTQRRGCSLSLDALTERTER